jgi:8-oxo-dGTP pyrophosphatase MutT (NUDIX family)
MENHLDSKNVQETKQIKLNRDFQRRDYCGNCGKTGHKYKHCIEPTTSLGVILFKIDGMEHDTVKNSFLDLLSTGERKPKEGFVKLKPLSKENNYGIPLTSMERDLNILNLYCQKIKFLLICRRNSLGYMEFMRGRYEDEKLLTSLFEQMTEKEIKDIDKAGKEKNFDSLWDTLWLSGRHKKRRGHIDHEYDVSKTKFMTLVEEKDEKKSLFYYTNFVKPKYKHPEWGFPKGRRNFYENNYDCAIREFREESGFANGEFTILNRVIPLREDFAGTNNVRYRHIYYVGYPTTTKELKINENNPTQIDEIGNIGWYTYDEVMLMLRPYHEERKRIMTQIYWFVLGRLIHKSSTTS